MCSASRRLAQADLTGSERSLLPWRGPPLHELCGLPHFCILSSASTAYTAEANSLRRAAVRHSASATASRSWSAGWRGGMFRQGAAQGRRRCLAPSTAVMLISSQRHGRPLPMARVPERLPGPAPSSRRRHSPASCSSAACPRKRPWLRASPCASALRPRVERWPQQRKFSSAWRPWMALCNEERMCHSPGASLGTPSLHPLA